MELFKKKSVDKVLHIPIHKIRPNPNQPRSIFNEKDLESLQQSIDKLGLLQPLTVRKQGDHWELIAGERRWRACQALGLAEVPCLQKEVSQEDSALLALVENIQRQDLDFMEEAKALSDILEKWGMSQEELSKQVGKSQSAVANMLRLLRLSEEVVAELRLGNCTQRHARALLKLPLDSQRLEILAIVREKGLNVQQTEELIADYLQESSPEPAPKKGKSLFIVKDVRLFLNSINKAVNLMHQAGIPADFHKEDSQEDILLTIKIPRNPPKAVSKGKLLSQGSPTAPLPPAPEEIPPETERESSPIHATSSS